MVVRFAIEPDAMVESAGDGSQGMKAQHKRLIALWERYGTLVDAGRGHNSVMNILEIDALRPVRTLWREAWKAKSRCRRIKPSSNRGIEWVDINQAADLATYECDIDLALVETTRGVVYLGIVEKDDVYSAYCGSVEAVLFRYPEQSEAFASMIQLSQKTIIPVGSHSEDIWRQWFQSIARKTTEVVIIDRYAFATRNFEGLCRIISLLRSDTSKCCVTIFASEPSTVRGNRVSDSVIEDRIRENLGPASNTLTAITVVFVPDYHMTRDRYVRFDECAFTIGHGLLEVFSRKRLSEDATCVLDTSPNGIIRAIQRETKRLRNKSCRELRFEAMPT